MCKYIVWCRAENEKKKENMHERDQIYIEKVELINEMEVRNEIEIDVENWKIGILEN